ncbi:MAG: Fic family protein [Spartobacteria bacterium]
MGRRLLAPRAGTSNRWRFVLNIRRKTAKAEAKQSPGHIQAKAHEAQVTPPVAVVVLIRLIGSMGPLGNSEILRSLTLSDRTHLREHYIDPAIADGLVERTIPDKPTSRLQKYRLTAKGQALLKELKKRGGKP